MATYSRELLSTVREREALPTGTASLMVSLDGMILRIQAETVGENGIDAGWRAAACGVVGVVDAAGNWLDAGCFGQLPEAGKETLKATLRSELFHWLTVDPNLKVVAVGGSTAGNDHVKCLSHTRNDSRRFLISPIAALTRTPSSDRMTTHTKSHS